MFEGLSNDEIVKALNELVNCFGVKEEVISYDLIDLIQKKKIESCVQIIAIQLGLPVRILLSYVPNDFSSKNSNKFRSTALSKTDKSGQGVESIVAQVSMPQKLPMYGTSKLKGFPIEVRVCENCHTQPDSFVTIIAHELSHILLASISSPLKDSELHTDLVPILLGFGNIVQSGRKVMKKTTNGNYSTTNTTTYGYLTDEQFEFAYEYIKEIRYRFIFEKEHLMGIIDHLRLRLKMAAQCLSKFRDYFRYLDKHPPKKMTQKHVQRLMYLHGQDYTVDWVKRINAIRYTLEAAESSARQMEHYTTSAIEQIKINIRILENATNDLERIIDTIAENNNIMENYVNFSEL